MVAQAFLFNAVFFSYDDVRPVIPPCEVVTPRDRHFTSYTHGGAADQAGHKASLAKSDNSCRRVMTTRGRSIHLHLSIFESAPEVRVLSCAALLPGFNGRMTLSDSRQSRRLSRR